jgi:hypothetical protein
MVTYFKDITRFWRINLKDFLKSIVSDFSLAIFFWIAYVKKMLAHYYY